AKTIGMVVVDCFSTAAALPYVTITSTCRRRNSAVKSLTRLELPPAQRYSISIVSPSIQPSSRRRATKATVHELQTVGSAPSTPICRGVPCCACATSGHAATVAESSSTNFRRVMGFSPRRGLSRAVGGYHFLDRELYRPSHSKWAVDPQVWVKPRNLARVRFTPRPPCDYLST